MHFARDYLKSCIITVPNNRSPTESVFITTKLETRGIDFLTTKMFFFCRKAFQYETHTPHTHDNEECMGSATDKTGIVALSTKITKSTTFNNVGVSKAESRLVRKQTFFKRL